MLTQQVSGSWWGSRGKRIFVRRYFEGVKVDCFVMIRFWWWIEANSSCVIIMTKMKWSWVLFSPGVREIEMSPDFANLESTIEDLIMNEMYWDSDVLDTRSNCFGL